MDRILSTGMEVVVGQTKRFIDYSPKKYEALKSKSWLLRIIGTPKLYLKTLSDLHCIDFEHKKNTEHISYLSNIAFNHLDKVKEAESSLSTNGTNLIDFARAKQLKIFHWHINRAKIYLHHNLQLEIAKAHLELNLKLYGPKNILVRKALDLFHEYNKP